MKEKIFSTNVLKQLNIPIKINKLQSNITLKWNIDLNVKAKTLTFLGNTGGKLRDTEVTKNLLDTV